MATRERTKYPGVYRRESKEKKFNGKSDACLDISFKQDGKKIWEKVGWLSEGYTEKLAADIRSERLRSMRHGEELPRQKKKAPFLDDVWAKYETWAEGNKKSAQDDVSRYTFHIRGRFGNTRMDSISPFHLERMKVELLKEGLAPATVKHCLVLIRQVYNRAMAWGLYQGGNPVKGVKMPSVQNQRTRFLSAEEASQLLGRLKAMRTPHLHDMALLSLCTGMRAGEIFNLRGYDLDFQNDIIQITDPKNKVTRHAYMTVAVKKMLQGRTPEKPEGLVFPDRNGNKIAMVSRRFGMAVDALGFNEGITDRRQRVTFHTLRHTFASWLAIQGESIITLKEMLGHRSTAMTERYAHLVPDHKRRAITGIEKNLAATSKATETKSST